MHKTKSAMAAGGLAVAGLFLSGSLLLASPRVEPSFKVVMPERSYLSYVKDDSKLLRSLGIKTEPKKTVAAAEKPQPAVPEPLKAVRAQAVAQSTASNAQKASQSAGNKVQVASRSTGSTAPPGITNYALSLQGIPYKYGGATTDGFDCSGYTKYVFSKFGVNLPRDSYSQFSAGGAVNKADLQPGDLVFFSTYAKGPSHVGIYLGGGKFIDSSDVGVAVQDLTRGYWGQRYIGARRVGK